MNKENTIQNSNVLLSFLLSSPIIFNPLYKSQNKLIAAVITTIAGIVFVYLISRIYSVKTRLNNSILSKLIFSVTFIVLIFIVGINICEFTKTVSVFSQFYTANTYRIVLGLCIILLSFYTSLSKIDALFRFGSSILILFCLYYVFMFFGLLSLTDTISPHEILTNEFSKKDFLTAAKSILFLFIDVSIFFFIQTKTNKKITNKKTSYIKTSVIYSAIIITNLSRTCFTFGSDLTSQIENCDIASIKLIPSFDLTEVVILATGFAIVLKSAFLFFAAKIVLKNVFANKNALYSIPILTFIIYTVFNMYISEINLFSSTVYVILNCLLPFLLFFCILYSNSEKI